MSPFEGHDLSVKYGKFDPPSADIMAAEAKDILTTWLRIQQSSIGSVVADSSWWMLRIMDADNRKGAEESMEILDGLTSFGMSIIGQLLDMGLIHMSEDVEIPEIVTSSDMMFSTEDFSILKQLDFLLEDLEDDD